MQQTVHITIDGVNIPARAGSTILEAADDAGIYIPRLCYHRSVTPHGSCRVCTVLVNGRPQAACTQPAADGMVIENNTPVILKHRRAIIDMLFVEGNHFCMFCEKSGRCELQAVAYRLGILAAQFPYQYPSRQVDASHPDIFLDTNRCILCGRCVQASMQRDSKGVFGFTGRSIWKSLTVSSGEGLSKTELSGTDAAADICPVGAIIRKRIGFDVPIGSRPYDKAPIGSEIETRRAATGDEKCQSQK